MAKVDVAEILATHYGSYLAGKDAVRCEVEARLFERELVLPPYDFLKGKDAVLFDFQVLNKCLRSKQ